MQKNWIDITQPLTNEIAVWPGDSPFEFKLSVTRAQTDSVNIGRLKTSVHTGTHVDAPFHFDDAGEKMHEVDVSTYIGRARVIDVASYDEIDRQVLEKFDLEGVKRLIFKTEKRRNPTVFLEGFTIIHPNVAPYLKERGVLLVGTDSPSVDPVDSKSLSAHHALNENGIYILENLFLEKADPGEYELIALPLKLVGADGSPVRAVIRPI